jgi:hypothetical protein
MNYDFPVSHVQTSAFPARLPEGWIEMFWFQLSNFLHFRTFKAAFYARRCTAAAETATDLSTVTLIATFTFITHTK